MQKKIRVTKMCIFGEFETAITTVHWSKKKEEKKNQFFIAKPKYLLML